MSTVYYAWHNMEFSCTFLISCTKASVCILSRKHPSFLVALSKLSWFRVAKEKYFPGPEGCVVYSKITQPNFCLIKIDIKTCWVQKIIILSKI